MTQEQQRQMARFTAVAQFCQRYARGLRMTSPGFDRQMEELGKAIAVIHLETRKGARSVVPYSVAQMDEARRALYEQLLVLARLARVVSQRTGEPVLVATPYAWYGASRLVQAACYVAGEGNRVRAAFLACGAPGDFLERLQRVAERVEQLRVTNVVARQERSRRSAAIQTAFSAAHSAVLCLDVVVGAYCVDGVGRRNAMWRQWREIVPCVRVPYMRRRERRERACVRRASGDQGGARTDCVRPVASGEPLMNTAC
jgi:hypothetical protein